MEKFTPEQLGAIEAVLRDFHQVPDGPNFKIAEEKADTILAALTRPAHSFREGEVVAFPKSAETDGYVACGTNGRTWGYVKARPLTQQEVGPDWVPKEPVKALREYVESFIPYETSVALRVEHRKALAAFDEAISHE